MTDETKKPRKEGLFNWYKNLFKHYLIVCRYFYLGVLYPKAFDSQALTSELASDFGNKALWIALLEKVAYTYAFEGCLFDFALVYRQQQPLVLLRDVTECNSTIAAKDD